MKRVVVFLAAAAVKACDDRAARYGSNRSEVFRLAIVEGMPGTVEALEKLQGDPDGRGSRRQRVAVVAYPGCAEAPWGGGIHAAFSTRMVPLLFSWTPPSPETPLPQGRKSELRKTPCLSPGGDVSRKNGEAFTCQIFSWDWVSRPKSLVCLQEARSISIGCQYPDDREMHHEWCRLHLLNSFHESGAFPGSTPCSRRRKSNDRRQGRRTAGLERGAGSPAPRTAPGLERHAPVRGPRRAQVHVAAGHLSSVAAPHRTMRNATAAAGRQRPARTPPSRTTPSSRPTASPSWATRPPAAGSVGRIASCASCEPSFDSWRGGSAGTAPSPNAAVSQTARGNLGLGSDHHRIRAHAGDLPRLVELLRDRHRVRHRQRRDEAASSSPSRAGLSRRFDGDLA